MIDDNIRLIDLTVGELRSIVKELNEECRANALSAMDECQEEEILEGNKSIAYLLNVSISKLTMMKPELKQYGAVWNAGYHVKGRRSRLLEYKAERMM